MGEGADLAAIAEQLGHSVKMLIKRYLSAPTGGCSVWATASWGKLCICPQMPRQVAETMETRCGIAEQMPAILVATFVGNQSACVAVET